MLEIHSLQVFKACRRKDAVSENDGMEQNWVALRKKL